MSSINTVYIISKGRPRCMTAQTLEDLGYPGDWFIVCGTNDETLPEYQKRWGDHVLVFDWAEEVKHTDVLDNFGFDGMASGAVPVRNATCRIARERGDERHWQLDDDYRAFYCTDSKLGKNVRIKDGQVLYDKMLQIAEYGHKAKLTNVGFSLSTIESHPSKARTCGRRVFNAHNMPTDPELFTTWRGRMNDDVINAIETWRKGGFELTFRHLQLNMLPSQQEQGGLTDLYRAEGTVRKTAYPILLAPNAVKLIIKFGRYHHTVNWAKLIPKLLNESYAK